jgi:D-amino peptidase
MILWISVDMEGISGIVDREQLLPSGLRYAQGVDYLVRDLRVVIDAAKEDPEINHIIVNDSHDGMINVPWRNLPEMVELISGGTKPHSMVQGVEKADFAFFLGYHAMAGAPYAVMDHTYSGDIYQVRLNGIDVGESAINAAMAGYFHVPVGFVSGDDKVVAEARQIMPWISSAVVKHATNRRAAYLLPPSEVETLLRQGVQDALTAYHAKRVQPYAITSPVVLEVSFMTTDMADRALYCPFTTRIEGRTVQFQHQSMEEVFRAFYTMMALVSGRPLY